MYAHDVKSHVKLIEGLASKQYSAGNRQSGVVDMSLYDSASFLLSAGAFGASATLDGKLQYSADGSTNWTDEPDTTYGNSTSMTQKTAAGTAQFNIVKPRARYYRLDTTSAVQTVDYGVTVAAFPKTIPA
jgi:hypothetical protein